MARRNWTEEDKSAALGLLADPEASYYDVHKATEVPVSTLHDWAAKAGLTGHSDALKQTESARAFRSERIALKRAVIAEKFLDYSEHFADAAKDIADGVIEVKQGVFISGGGDAKNLMTAAAIALDKFRLEMGEPTSRTFSESAPAADVAKSKLDELGARRQSKSA